MNHLRILKITLKYIIDNGIKRIKDVFKLNKLVKLILDSKFNFVKIDYNQMRIKFESWSSYYLLELKEDKIDITSYLFFGFGSVKSHYKGYTYEKFLDFCLQNKNS